MCLQQKSHSLRGTLSSAGHHVALELEWVLRGAYKLPREAVITAFEGLLALRHLHLEQEELVRRALEWHRQGLDFADALHLVRSEGCGALISFDRQLALAAGQVRVVCSSG